MTTYLVDVGFSHSTWDEGTQDTAVLIRSSREAVFFAEVSWSVFHLDEIELPRCDFLYLRVRSICALEPKGLLTTSG